MKGKVIKTVGGVFSTYANGKTYTLFAPKKLRYMDNNVLVGDNVEFTLTAKSRGIIDKVLPRTNSMIRPELANVDIAMLVVTSAPMIDMMLIDKMIINCHISNIKPVIVVNKSDMLTDEFVSLMHANYDDVAELYLVSALTSEGIDNIISLIDGNTVCMAGQSAVGKTSILNRLIPNLNKEVGGLSAKTNRGTHTTRYSKIFCVHGGYIADTTGFSLFDLLDIHSSQLALYYPEFTELSHNCKYNMCTHSVEPDCAVRSLIKANGEQALPRYNRYLQLFELLKEQEKNQF